MTPPSGPSYAPERPHATIGWFTATCLLISNIIGGGIFTTTGLMARDLGDPRLILLLWSIGGLFAIGGAMIYGELGSRLPHAGGDYVYLRETYGPLVAFLSGWTSFTIGFGAAVAASAISFSAYAMRALPIEDERGWWAKGLSLGLLWIVTVVHCKGLESGGRLQRLITSTKVLAIGGLIFAGLFAGAGHWDFLSVTPADSHPTPGAAAIALVIVTYCYLGWNVAGFIAAEIGNPRRTLPRVMIGGTAFVAAIYLLLNLVYLSALSIGALAQEPIIPVAEKAASALWGPDSGRIVAIILCLSIAGAVSAMTWAGPRVYWAMARDGAISPWLAARAPRTGVPARAILFQTSWASVLILSGTFEQLLIYSGLVLAFFMTLTLSAIFLLRRGDLDHGRHFRAPFYPFLPAALVIGAFSLVLYSVIQRPAESLYGTATVLSGIPLYLFWKRQRRPNSSIELPPRPRSPKE
ncbi:MAG TPA: amino acid permease [Nitrospira sp.]|nr:amino acid permease [Nitrospira sp.]HSE65611.1 amino acid permease [Gemmatimonadales bacterium]